MQPKALVGRPLPEHPQLPGYMSSRGGFNSVDVGLCNREEKVGSRHGRDREKTPNKTKQNKKATKEREERKDRGKKGKRRKRENGRRRREMEKESKRDYFYNYCGLARIKGN